MRLSFLLALALCTVAPAFSQFSISANKRFLLQKGQPFFWLGDTAWELIHRLNREETDIYLKKRSDQGFTVIQAVALAELDGLHTPNAYGERPLLNDDPSTPNEKYFAHLDYVIDKAASLNMAIALLPTWGDKLFKDRWGMGPEIFNQQTAATYGAWLAKRYREKTNIIWVLGGDRIPRNQSDVDTWRSMGTAIMKATANKAIITFHPQPNQLGSAEWFHQDGWLSFNMFQTGHCRDAAVYDRIQAVYNLQPVKPVMDGEPIYEDHPVCFNVKDLGTSNALDVRRSAYLDVFAGAFGHTYGCHDVWQMFAKDLAPVNGPHMSWSEALDLPGATQMIHLKKLVMSFPYEDRVPDQAMLKDPNTAPAERVQATRGKDYLFVYTAAGKAFTLLPGKISGTELQASWYDPRTGKYTALPAFGNTTEHLFTPPSSGYGKDWVLVVSSKAISGLP